MSLTSRSVSKAALKRVSPSPLMFHLRPIPRHMNATACLQAPLPRLSCGPGWKMLLSWRVAARGTWVAEKSPRPLAVAARAGPMFPLTMSTSILDVGIPPGW